MHYGSRCVSEPQAYARLKPRQFRGVLRHFKGVLRHFKGVLRRFKATCDLNFRQCRSFHIKGVPRHLKGVPRHFKSNALRFVLFAAPYTTTLAHLVERSGHQWMKLFPVVFKTKHRFVSQSLL